MPVLSIAHIYRIIVMDLRSYTKDLVFILSYGQASFTNHGCQNDAQSQVYTLRVCTLDFPSWWAYPFHLGWKSSCGSHLLWLVLSRSEKYVENFLGHQLVIWISSFIPQIMVSFLAFCAWMVWCRKLYGEQISRDGDVGICCRNCLNILFKEKVQHWDKCKQRDNNQFITLIITWCTYHELSITQALSNLNQAKLWISKNSKARVP